jgi:hypothetical protein
MLTYKQQHVNSYIEYQVEGAIVHELIRHQPPVLHSQVVAVGKRSNGHKGHGLSKRVFIVIKYMLIDIKGDLR